MSEIHAPAELNDAGIPLACYPSEGRAGQIGHRSVQIAAVERVEEVASKLRLELLANSEASDDADILLGRPEAADVRKEDTQIAERERLRRGERTAIEVIIPLLARESVEWLKIGAAWTDRDRRTGDAVGTQCAVEDRQVVGDRHPQRRSRLISVNTGHAPSAQDFPCRSAPQPPLFIPQRQLVR